MSSTTDAAYTERLRAAGRRHGWRRVVDPQLPYRWNIRRLVHGRVLDVGCGIGRNLAHLDGAGVGVDHNPSSVDAARSRGLVAYTPEGFAESPDAQPAGYGTVLFAHVLEHLIVDDAVGLVRTYLPYLAPDGRVIAICPQQRGQRSDATHVTYLPAADLAALLGQAGLVVERLASFPLPRAAGRWFTHNETIAVARRVSPTV